MRSSSYKQLCKSAWSSSKRVTVRKGPVFCKSGDKISFNFRHFVKPQKLVEEYLRTHIYDKPRFVKITDKEAVNTIGEGEECGIVDRYNCTSKLTVKHGKPQNRLSNETQTSERKFRKTTGNVPGWSRTSQMLRRRIPATHNFVYDFNPFGSSSPDLYAPPSLKEATSKSINNNKQSLIRTQSQPMAVLPKLSPRDNFTFDNTEKRKRKFGLKQGANLPIITGTEKWTGQQTVKKGIEETTEIDREVEKVKSSWQLLRGGRGWTSGKDVVTNNRTRKLYETLERVTQEIDKIQRSYLDTKTNRYLHQGAVKTLTDGPSLEEEAKKIRDLIFPKERHDNRSNKKQNDLQRISTISINNAGKVSVTRSRNADRNSKSDANCNSRTNLQIRPKSVSQITRDRLKEINADFEKYLETYVKDAEKSFMRNKNEIIELEPSPDDVTKMLQGLNLRSLNSDRISDNSSASSHSISENANTIKQKQRISTGNDHDNDYSSSKETSQDTIKPARLTTTAEFNEKIGNIESGDGVSTKDRSLKQCNMSFNTSSQTNTTSDYGTNIFMKMGLSELCNDLPKSVLSRVLESEYLKKDLSLRPM